MTAHLIYRDGYPTFAPRATTARSWGLCAIQPPHEAELHDSLCARHWAQIQKERHARRLWHERLSHWWRQHCLLISTVVLLVAWVLLVWELGALLYLARGW